MIVQVEMILKIQIKRQIRQTVLLPKLTSSTPINKFDKTRLDLVAVGKQLEKLKPQSNLQLSSDESLAESAIYTDDTTLIKYYTSKDTTPFSSVSPTPGEKTPKYLISDQIEPEIESVCSSQSNSQPIVKEVNLKTSRERIDSVTSDSVETLKSQFRRNSSDDSENIVDSMALTSAQYSDIIPSCKDVRDEQL